MSFCTLWLCCLCRPKGSNSFSVTVKIPYYRIHYYHHDQNALLSILIFTFFISYDRHGSQSIQDLKIIFDTKLNFSFYLEVIKNILDMRN